MNGHTDNDQQAWNRALALLARRDYSAAQLCQKLRAAGVEQALAEQVVRRCQELGYQSDERCAQAMVRSAYGRGHGPYKVRQKMQQAQISEELANRCLNDAQYDWFELAASVYLRRFAQGACQNVSSDDEWVEHCESSYEHKQALWREHMKEKGRQTRFLVSRGFGPDHIEYAFNQASQD